MSTVRIGRETRELSRRFCSLQLNEVKGTSTACHQRCARSAKRLRCEGFLCCIPGSLLAAIPPPHMAGCFLCIKQALLGGFCGGCGANAFLIGIFALWLALKTLALYIWGDVNIEAGEVLVRATDALSQWMGGRKSNRKSCCDAGRCEGKVLKIADSPTVAERQLG